MPRFAKAIDQGAQSAGVVVKLGGVYVCIEGPQFSTRAESNLYRSWGADVIGMTNLQEAKLAREAEICYATMAMVTDYDCWHEGHDAVTVDQVVAGTASELSQCRQGGARRGCGYAAGACLRVRDGFAVRYPHQPGCLAGRNPAQARSAAGQVFSSSIVRKNPCPFW